MASGSVCNAQHERFEINIQGRFGLTKGHNTFESDFSPQFRKGVGLHTTLDYNGKKFGFTSGVGIDYLAFQSEVNYFVTPQFQGNWAFGMAYFALQVPVLLTYRPIDKFKVLAGVNLMWASWDEYSSSWEQMGPSPELTTFSDESLSDSQLVAEWMLQTNYSLVSRLSLGVYLAGSLKELDGVNHTQILSNNGQEFAQVHTNFRYNWWRIGVSLNYALFQSKSR